MGDEDVVVPKKQQVVEERQEPLLKTDCRVDFQKIASSKNPIFKEMAERKVREFTYYMEQCRKVFHICLYRLLMLKF